MSDIESIIQQLERQKTAIDEALQALRSMSGGVTTGTGRGSKRAGVSPEGRQRQIEAMKRYWAEKRAGRAPAKKKRGGGGLTAEGRQALAENMKRMWAAKRSASQAGRKGTKKRAS